MPLFQQKQPDPPGFYQGKHYTDHIATVDSLARVSISAAIALLLHLVDAAEAEAAHEQLGVAPWPYERLAVLYRKQDDAAAEVAILERFARQRHTPGATPAKLQKRLEQAKERLGKVRKDAQ